MCPCVKGCAKRSVRVVFGVYCKVIYFEVLHITEDKGMLLGHLPTTSNTVHQRGFGPERVGPMNLISKSCFNKDAA